MEYTPDQIIKINQDKAAASQALTSEYRALVMEVVQKLQIEKAREYLNHGVGRRLKIIGRCLDRVFEIFPADRQEVLTPDEVTDVEIHLHAFVINANGLLDNLAWVYILEKGLLETVGGHRGVGLFKRETQELLPTDVRAYLASDRMRSWNNEYAKDYRDSLAHRIPLYVPPAAIDPNDAERHRQLDSEMFQAILAGDLELADSKKREQDSLQSVCLTAVHSYSESRMVWFHAQMVADANTVLAISQRMRPYFASV